ncbi:MAG: hypothetical protein M9928_06740 [Anaerolineae bacterium]|nr:hypothetical protein [Anaerolineae bacterium]MCO5194615.1 hypothetical protein [Anaerolineae bacterium]MCO5204708.1 hypothetical protein [Anaerolineae bacterium]
MALIAHTSPNPLYTYLKEILAACIDSAEWQPGDLIPDEIDRQNTCSQSRSTVCRTVAELVNITL